MTPPPFSFNSNAGRQGFSAAGPTPDSHGIILILNERGLSRYAGIALLAILDDQFVDRLQLDKPLKKCAVFGGVINGLSPILRSLTSAFSRGTSAAKALRWSPVKSLPTLC